MNIVPQCPVCSDPCTKLKTGVFAPGCNPCHSRRAQGMCLARGCSNFVADGVDWCSTDHLFLVVEVRMNDRYLREQEIKMRITEAVMPVEEKLARARSRIADLDDDMAKALARIADLEAALATKGGAASS